MPLESEPILSGNNSAAPGRMAGARHFRELVCWELACELKVALYRFVEAPHVKRDFKFYSQVRNAAASAPRNIAEGFGRRTHADSHTFSTSRELHLENARTTCRMPSTEAISRLMISRLLIVSRSEGAAQWQDCSAIYVSDEPLKVQRCGVPRVRQCGYGATVGFAPGNLQISEPARDRSYRRDPTAIECSPKKRIQRSTQNTPPTISSDGRSFEPR